MQNYIDPSEYAAFGIGSISADKIDNACMVVDAYLSRPAGLLYTADTSGLPLYMTRKATEGSFTLRADIAAGTNVAAQISPGPILSVGSALVLDKGTPNFAETVYVKQIVDSTHVVFASVSNAHAQGATLESGLLVEETMNVPKGRYFVTLPCGPIRRLVSLVGRVSYSRRGDSQGVLSPQTYGLLTSVSQFGGAPIWQIIEVTNSDIDLEKNQVWTPMGLLMTPYTQVRVAYVAGFTYASLPFGVKRATATIARAINESPAGASVSVFKAGEVQMERFLASVIDDDTRMMLSPYKASLYV